MKKIFFIITMLCAIPFFASAAQLDISTDKTIYTDDELVHISISVNGSVDNGQVGIQGLENFDIVGKRSSQSMQTINGQTSVVQKQNLTLRPHAGGRFTITALAQENGQEISSQILTIDIKKSPTQTLKEDLLNNTQQDEQQPNVIQDNIQDQNLEDIINKQEPISDFDIDLLRESQTQSSHMEEKSDISTDAQSNQLQLQKIENFPQVQHNSAFNTFFWLELLGIVVLLVIIIVIIVYFTQKRNLS